MVISSSSVRLVFEGATFFSASVGKGSKAIHSIAFDG